MVHGALVMEMETARMEAVLKEWQISLQTFFGAAESASQRREEAQWRPRWPPIYTQWAARGPLVAMKVLGTEEASLH